MHNAIYEQIAKQSILKNNIKTVKKHHRTIKLSASFT